MAPNSSFWTAKIAVLYSDWFSIMIHTVAINKDGYDLIYLVLNYYKHTFTKKGVQIPGNFSTFPGYIVMYLA